ncbi:hypothetical protein Tco_1441047, partial [Tanacetum coccineum]
VVTWVEVVVSVWGGSGGDGGDSGVAVVASGGEIMSPLVAQQVTLDDALVAPDNRVVISKCNMRIDPTKT